MFRPPPVVRDLCWTRMRSGRRRGRDRVTGGVGDAPSVTLRSGRYGDIPWIGPIRNGASASATDVAPSGHVIVANVKFPQDAKSGAKHAPGPVPVVRLSVAPAVTGVDPEDLAYVV